MWVSYWESLGREQVVWVWFEILFSKCCQVSASEILLGGVQGSRCGAGLQCCAEAGRPGEKLILLVGPCTRTHAEWPTDASCLPLTPHVIRCRPTFTFCHKESLSPCPNRPPGPLTDQHQLSGPEAAGLWRDRRGKGVSHHQRWWGRPDIAIGLITTLFSNDIIS